MKKKNRTHSAAQTRPWWFPSDGGGFQALPEEVRLALEEVVPPLHHSLVVEAEDALERSLGSTIVFVAVIEVRIQFELFERLVGLADTDAAELVRLADAYARLVELKKTLVALVAQLQITRLRRDRATLASSDNDGRTRESTGRD